MDRGGMKISLHPESAPVIIASDLSVLSLRLLDKDTIIYLEIKKLLFLRLKELYM